MDRNWLAAGGGGVYSYLYGSNVARVIDFCRKAGKAVVERQINVWILIL